MKYNNFKFYKTVLVIILAILVGVSVTVGNYIIPIIGLVVGVVLLLLLKTNVNTVLTDERVDKIAGSAAKITMVVSTFGMAIAGVILISLRTKYPEFLLLGNVLAYITCGMLILYAILFKFYNLK
jgi:uncharacterized membrane protein